MWKGNNSVGAATNRTFYHKNLLWFKVLYMLKILLNKDIYPKFYFIFIQNLTFISEMHQVTW